MASAMHHKEFDRPTAAGEAGPILRMRGVDKTFQHQHVLVELDLDIGQGEFLTLLGPSGCGKSTTLNIVAGLLQPDRGEVSLRGTRANDLPPQRRRLGMVFQSWALFPHMTVLDNVAYGLRMQGVRDAAELRRRVGRMLDLVRLPGAEGKFPSQLSGGMQQRVALARALITEPDLLLLDEPLSNLDAGLRKEMQVELKRIHEQLQVSTLLVTHSQEEALVMSDRIAVMRAGRIARIDTPQNVYHDPRSAFVCRFVGDANLMAASVLGADGDGLRLRTASGLELQAPAVPGWSAGQEIAIALRPEVFVLGAAAEAADTTWEAVVTDTIFLGSAVTYEVEAGTEKLVVFSIPQATGGTVHARGSRIRLGFARSGVIPLDPDEDAA